MLNPLWKPQYRSSAKLLLLVSFAAMGCAKHPPEVVENTAAVPTDPAPPSASPDPSPLHGNWVLIQIGDAPLAPRAAPKPPSIEFQSQEGRVIGFTGCNRMMGNYTASDESGLSFDQLGSTKRACLPNGPEGLLIKGLSETERYRLDGSELVLIDSEHTELLRFRKAD